MEIDQSFLEALLGASEICGVFLRCEDTITVHHREDLLRKMRKTYIPALLEHKDMPEVRRILEAYNYNITLSGYREDHTPVELD